jgi:hypothetical protein
MPVEKQSGDTNCKPPSEKRWPENDVKWMEACEEANEER